MKKTITHISLLIAACWSFSSLAQTVNTGLPISISDSTTVTISGGNFTSAGAISNQGTLRFSNDIEVSGDYTGSGTLVATGDAQNLNISSGVVGDLQVENGEKTLQSDLTITDLTFQNATINTGANALLVTGQITGAGADSYVDGILRRSTADSLDFPIAIAGSYAPIAFDQIEGTDPVLEVTAVGEDPNGQVGKGLLAVDDQRYWSMSVVSGQLTAARPSLSVENSTIATGITDATGAFSVNPGGTFRGLGLAETTGDLTSGTVTPTEKSGAGIYTLGLYFDESLKEADSTALVAFYDNAGGENWTSNSNWKAGDLETWSNITVDQKRVTSIDLSANNLQNTIPDVNAGLENVETLDLSDNELTDIGDLTNLASINTLNVSNNRLQFGTLEELLAFRPQTLYAPQKAVLTQIRILEDLGTTYTMDRTVTGTANEYNWIKNGAALNETTATFDIPINDFSVDGTYIAQVTNENVAGLTLTTLPVILRVSSIERDSASLILVYEALVKDSTEINDWPTLPIADWEGVTIAGSRVTGLDLSGRKLAGELPVDISDVAGLEEVNLSNNHINGLPDLTINQLDTRVFDVSVNSLDPGDIEPNLNFTGGLNYDDQRPFGEFTYQQIDRGENVVLVFDIGGTANSYRWRRNGIFVSDGGLADSIVIEDLGFDNMGDYQLVVQNNLLGSDFTLTSRIQRVLAQTDISLVPLYEDLNGEDAALTDGDGTGELYRITEPGQPYVPIDTVNISNGQVLFEDIILDDYVVLVRPIDTLIVKDLAGQNDSVEVLPTYYAGNIDWLLADPIILRDPFSDNLFMEQKPRPLTPADGDGLLDMLVESDFAEEADGRIDARRRVRKAGCSLRRRVTGGGGRIGQDDDEFVLIAYKETDDEGNVSFGNIPAGEYRINIQYPGVPMDESSEIDFVIEEGEEGAAFDASVTITEDGIAVDLEKVLGVIREYFKDLVVYPNPADEYFTLRYKKLVSDQVRMRMVSLSGAVATELEVEKGFDKEIEVNTQDLTEGVYLLYFFDEKRGEKVLTYKVIVKH